MRDSVAPNYIQMTAILKLEALSIGYTLEKSDKKVIAENIVIDLHAGGLVCLLGPNGAGKSTLMRTISGMQLPLRGKVLLDGIDLHKISPSDLAKQLSVVLTTRIDTGLLTAYEVISLGRYPYTNWSGKLTDHDHEIIQRAIKMTRSEELIQRPIYELSDGERQKIMMARALAQEPQVMILDEVTAFLDLPRRVDFMQMLKKMAEESGCAILLSTHDLDLALRAADQIWLLPKNGEFIVGSPESLVLNGAFEKVFESEGIHFDRQSGSFQLNTSFHTAIQLKGDKDEHFLWTGRALERYGFKVGKGKSSICVEIVHNQGKPCWVWENNGTHQTFDHLEDMMKVARKSCPSSDSLLC